MGLESFSIFSGSASLILRFSFGLKCGAFFSGVASRFATENMIGEICILVGNIWTIKPEPEFWIDFYLHSSPDICVHSLPARINISLEVEIGIVKEVLP